MGKKKSKLSFSGVLYCDTLMGGGERERNDRMEWRGCWRGDYIYIYIYTYTTYLGSKEISHQKIVYLFVSLFLNTSSNFQLVSFFKTHLTDYFCVRVFNNDCCGVPKMFVLYCRLSLFFKGQQTGCEGGGGQGEPTLKVQVSYKVSVKGRMEWLIPPPHTLRPSLFEIQPHKWQEASAFLSFLGASLSFPLSSRTAYKTWLGQRGSSSI